MSVLKSMLIHKDIKHPVTDAAALAYLLKQPSENDRTIARAL